MNSPGSGAAARWPSSLLRKSPSSGEVLVELDGLRGLAVLIVLASHTQAFGMWGQGAMGVWMFFVLSAFLLTRILVQKLPASLMGPALGKYVIRRIARILPCYYLVLILVKAATGRDMAWLADHAIFRRADAHFWSIPQEELFYVLLPVLLGLLVLLQRALSRIPLWVFAAGLLVALELSHPLLMINGNGGKQPFCLNVFGVGFFLAVIWPTRKFEDLRSSAAFRCIANVLTCLVAPAILLTAPGHLKMYRTRFGLSSVFPSLEFLGWQYPTLSAGLCALLLGLVLTPGTWASRISSWTPLRLVGVLSFGLYLVHPFVMEALATHGAPSAGALLFLLTLIGSLAIGLLLERVVERPCMEVGRRLNARF
jgi:peptidoglycan/LPS O-acetylase OafA/YrhL